jgi:hypothetical protein
VAYTYITALFDYGNAAEAAKQALAGHAEVTIHRAFVIHRDERGYHVDGRFAGKPPSDWLSHLGTAVARLILGTSREEDSLAIADAEAELSAGQSALVALIDERDSTITDDVIHAAGGTMIRVAPQTLDAEDRERFFEASSVIGMKPLP